MTTNYSKLTSNKKTLEKEINKLQFVPKIKEEYDYEGQNKTGDFIEYYENGKIKRQGSFNNNLYNGSWVYYYENGNIKAEGKFINGNGQDVSETSGIPKNGREGVWIFYYESGEKEKESIYKSGKINGEFKSFFKNGNIKTIDTRVNDIANGVYRKYFENGKLQEEGNLIDNKFDGIIKQYSESGNLLYEFNYFRGLKNGIERHFFSSGKIQIEKNFKNNLEDGECKEFYISGKLKLSETKRNNKSHGPFKSYFENGNIEFSGTTDSSSLAISNLIGELIQYNEDGEIKTKFLFHKNGIMEELPNKSVVSSSNTNYTTQNHQCVWCGRSFKGLGYRNDDLSVYNKDCNSCGSLTEDYIKISVQMGSNYSNWLCSKKCCVENCHVNN